ncbi:MAG: hypothetical protein ILP11_00370 [Alphaproteobacteria bacterium]|nr:hypothetical protein [Alphaproteobacteria bacterium]
MAKKTSKKTAKKTVEKKVAIASKQPVRVVKAPQKPFLSRLVALLLLLVTIGLGYILINYKVVLIEKAHPSLVFTVVERPGFPAFPAHAFMRRQPPVVLPKIANQVKQPHDRGPRRARRRVVGELNPPVKAAEVQSVQEAKKDKHYACRAAAPRKAKFVAEEYAPYQKKGEAIIAGKVCLTLEDNTEKCFPNSRVIINPVTSYSQEWYTRGWAGTEYLEEADPRVTPTNLIQITDEKGAFAFKNLPAGAYYVGAEVCVPKTKDAKECIYTRLGARVKMKRYVTPTFKKVFSVRQ